MNLVAELVTPLVVTCMLLANASIGPLTLFQNLLWSLPHSFTLLRLERQIAIEHWAEALLLGPLPLAGFALLVVFVGQIVSLHASTRWSGCDELATLVGAAVIVAYVFLVVYSWAFLGFAYDLQLYGRRLSICRPFPHLGFLALCYIDLCANAVFVAGLLTRAPRDACPSGALKAFTVFVLFFFCIAFVLILYKTVRHALAANAAFKYALDHADYRLSADETTVRRAFQDTAGNDSETITFPDIEKLSSILQLPPHLATQANALASPNGTLDIETFWSWYEARVLKGAESGPPAVPRSPHNCFETVVNFETKPAKPASHMTVPAAAPAQLSQSPSSMSSTLRQKQSRHPS